MITSEGAVLKDDLPVLSDATSVLVVVARACWSPIIQSGVFLTSLDDLKSDDARLLVRGGGVGPLSACSNAKSLFFSPRTDTLSEGARLCRSVVVCVGEGERGSEGCCDARDSNRCESNVAGSDPCLEEVLSLSLPPLQLDTDAVCGMHGGHTHPPM